MVSEVKNTHFQFQIMDPQQTFVTSLSVQVIGNDTGIAETVSISVNLPPSYTGNQIVPTGLEVAGCSTGDGSARAVGQLFAFQNGILVGSNTIAQLHNEWHIGFTSVLQNTQVTGTNSDYMTSIVYFRIVRGDDFNHQGMRELSCIIQQDQGDADSYEQTSLTVIPPNELQGEINFGQFRDAVEGYYRSVIGSGGSGIHIHGSSNIVMSNNRFVQPGSAVISVANPTIDSAW